MSAPPKHLVVKVSHQARRLGSTVQGWFEASGDLANVRARARLFDSYNDLKTQSTG